MIELSVLPDLAISSVFKSGEFSSKPHLMSVQTKLLY